MKKRKRHRRPNRQRTSLSLLSLVVLSLFLGCSHTLNKKNWSDYTGPGAEYFQQEEIDPLIFPDLAEPLNRSVWAVNHGLITGLVHPLSSLYRLIVPRPARNGITRFGTNLLYPRRLVANLLQGKFTQAGTETQRFGINTTVGVLGFFDRATEWGIEAADEDFGQTFAAWGWKPSTYLVLPVFGPSSVRDGLGLIPDTALNPASYFFPASPVLNLNQLSDFVPTYRRLTRTTYDPYQLAKVLWTLARDNDLADYDYEPGQGPAVESLQAVFLTYQDPKFPGTMRQRSIAIVADRRKLPYSYRLQPQPAPLLFIVPGLGAHREGTSSLGLAEAAYREGFSVVTISSSMNWEFMERASSVAVPGHAPMDAHDVHVALDAIHRDLTTAHPDQITARALMGYSLGALHTFYIAAAEQYTGNNLIDFDRYVTLDSPVRLITGMAELDAFYNAPLVFPPDEREERMKLILRKTIDLSQELLKPDVDLPFSHGELAPVREIPLSQVEAEFLIGLSFRLILQNVIHNSQTRHDLGVLQTKPGWFRRNAAYAEIFDYSYMEYFYAFVLPYYLERDPSITSPESMIARNDLRSLEEALRTNGKIRHFASQNDFLVTQEDITWLIDTLGEEHVRIFPTGGHLGGLYKPEVQHEIMLALSDLTTTASPAHAKP